MWNSIHKQFAEGCLNWLKRQEEMDLDHTGWVEGQREKLEFDLVNDIAEGQCVVWKDLSWGAAGDAEVKAMLAWWLRLQ